MTLKELEQELLNSFDKSKYRQYAARCHPDAVPTSERDLATKIFKILQELMEDKPTAILKGKYKVGQKLYDGSISDIFKCDNGFLKLALSDRLNPYIIKELEALKCFSGDKTFSRMVPKVVDEVTIDRRAGFIYTIDSVGLPLNHWSRLDGRHTVWIFKRVLMILGYAHRQEIIHGAVTPDHIIVNYETHGITLIDWCFSGKIGYAPTKVPSKEGRPKEKKYTAASDIYMAAKSVYHVGLPLQMQRFLETCFVNNGRPDNAWELHDEFSELAKKLYGAPKFVDLLP